MISRNKGKIGKDISFRSFSKWSFIINMTPFTVLFLKVEKRNKVTKILS